MIHNTVKSPQKAKEIIDNYINDNGLQDGFFERETTVRCQCGETSAQKWFNGSELLIVAYCDLCGDDDAFVTDVLKVLS